MLPTSLVISVSLEFAAIETVNLHQEFITPELMLAGITKLQDFIGKKPLLDVDIATWHSFCQEAGDVLLAMSNVGLDVRIARRLLRHLVGVGDYVHGNGTVLHRTDNLKDAFRRANEIASDKGESYIATQYILLAILETEDTLIPKLLESFNINLENLLASVRSIDTARASDTQNGLPHSSVSSDHGSSIQPPRQESSAGGVSGTALATFGVDLVESARQKKIWDVFERDNEILQLITTLSRSQKNNPILIGDPGVGKTAIVEGLAFRIAKGNVPPHFRNKKIIQVDLGQLLGGTKYRGSFEERIVQLVDEVKRSQHVILFIDEIHMIIGAGEVGSGAMDAGNMLKNAMSRGGFALIGATTTAEYNAFIQRDRALERRFTPIYVLEPSEAVTHRILMARISNLHESYNNAVSVQEEAVKEAINLANRYLPDRSFPDKAFELLDEACALAVVGTELDNYAQSVDDECIAVTDIHIQEVVRRAKHIEDRETLLERLRRLEGNLKTQIIGQGEAIEQLVPAIQISYLNLKRKGSPMGVFLYVGPTGVGKTQLAKAVAEFMFGGEDNIIRLDMSEYMEKHSVSRLIGAPPGYIGFEEGGQLTSALRVNPQTVVLLDEVEKAHADVVNVFLQVFSDGRLTDGRGRVVDASRALFIMTSNLGYQDVSSDVELPSERDVMREIEWHFRPEFLNRLDKVVHFAPLRREHMLDIVDIHFNNFKNRVTQNFQISLELIDDARDWLAENGYDLRMGVRPLIRLIETELSQKVGMSIVDNLIKQGDLLHIIVNQERTGLVLLSKDNATLD